ncbi:hypothetical protein OROMI_006993 [Orobanche minor]
MRPMEYQYSIEKVHYEGLLAETGEVFDTTKEDNTVFTFELGKGSVIKAWDIALKTMKGLVRLQKSLVSQNMAMAAQVPHQISPKRRDEYLSNEHNDQAYWLICQHKYGGAFSIGRATLVFEVELVACRPRKGSSLSSVLDERARLEELRKQRDLASAVKEEEKKKREEAKVAAAARIQAKLDAKRGQGKGKGKPK